MHSDTRTLRGSSGAVAVAPSRQGSRGAEEKHNETHGSSARTAGADALEPERWFVAVQGRPWGPMCFRTLLRLVHLRAVHARTLAWRTGSGGWQPLWCQTRLRQLLSRPRPKTAPIVHTRKLRRVITRYTLS